MYSQKPSHQFNREKHSASKLTIKTKFDSGGFFRKGNLDRAQVSTRGEVNSMKFHELDEQTVLPVTSPGGDDFRSITTITERPTKESKTHTSLRRMIRRRTPTEIDTGILNSTHYTKSVERDEEGRCNVKSLKRDVASMEVPRRQRSKRSTTVVRLPGFTIQKLPFLLPSEYTSEEQCDEVESIKEFTEKSELFRVYQRSKTHMTPERVLVPDMENKHLEHSDSQFSIRTTRRPRANSFLQVATELFEKEHSSPSSASEAPKRRRRRRKIKKAPTKTSRRRRKGMQKRTKAPTGLVKKRSLRSIIQSCLRKQRGGSRMLKVSDRDKLRKPLKQRKTVNFNQYHHSIRKLNDVSSISFDKNVRSCPTVTYLLTQKLIHVGDIVELLSEEAEPMFHGWFTSRGILCSNCGMVHSCKTFGACQSASGGLDCISFKDGIRLSQLLDGHNVTDFQ
eukprot:g5660.t1